MKGVVFLDFDGTVYDGDSFKIFLALFTFCWNPLKILFYLVKFRKMKFPLMVKASLISSCTGSFKKNLLRYLVTKLSSKLVLDFTLLRHRFPNVDFVIVSASPNLYLEILGQQLSIDVIATRFENNVFVYVDRESKYVEAVKYLRSKKITAVPIFAFGNCHRDSELFNVASRAFVVNCKKSCLQFLPLHCEIVDSKLSSELLIHKLEVCLAS